jgi:hypothetical protein
MDFPSLPYDFNDALITNVTFGPRREFTLILSVLIWEDREAIIWMEFDYDLVA